MTRCASTTRAGARCARDARADGPVCGTHSGEARSDRMCPTCHIRWRKKKRVDVGWSSMTRSEYRWLEQMALEFDSAGELFTSEEFVSWLRADLTVFRQYKVPETDGVSVMAGGGRFGVRPTRMSTGSPLPWFDTRGLEETA